MFVDARITGSRAGIEPREIADTPTQPVTLRSLITHVVHAALEAFEDGLYFVFIDDRQIETLDERVTVGAGSRVRFLRLVALAGG